MQECKSALQEDLKAYLDGELPPHYRVAVEKHLASCPSCQAELTALRLLATQLTETLPTTATLPDALRTRILAALPEPPAPRRLLLPFWRRPGPMTAFGGALAMGCAFWLWLKVPQTTGLAPTKAVQVAAPLPESRPERMTFSSSGSDTKNRALKSENTEVTPAPKVPPPAKPAAPTAAKSATPVEPPATRTPAVAEAKSAEALSPPTQSNAVDKSMSRSLPQETLSSSKAVRSMAAPQQQESAKKAEVALDSPTPQAALPATANLPAPNQRTYANKIDIDKGEKKDSDIAGAMVRDASAFLVPSPAATYTLTIPAGKRTETLEAIRKLAGELSVSLNSEQPYLDMRLPSDGREALLERLKALGKLAETPAPVAVAKKKEPAKPDVATRGGFGGGRGGGGAFGGGGGGFASGRSGSGVGRNAELNMNKLPLRLTLILKEAPPEEPQ